MVLEHKPTNQGIRFIVGICIIAVSIYAFYISLARKNSPELFLRPEIVRPVDYPCKTAQVKDFTLCIPSDLAFSYGQSGLEFYSAQSRIRGTVRVLDELPQEKPWRDSLRKPWIRWFIGETKDINTFGLMKSILEHRYNPTLMGIKAQLIPPWMKKADRARIIIPEGNNALLFYTNSQFMGILFSGRDTILFSCAGNMDAVLAASLMDSFEPI